MKIRASGLSAKVVTALGGSAVGLPITDTYDALSKGVVEGLVLDWGGILNWKMGDLVKHHIESPGVAATVAFFTVMNKDKWNSLPRDIQVLSINSTKSGLHGYLRNGPTGKMREKRNS
jgi:TRAP-type C4-dicarboxylate transport system substrate-binding protein